MDTSLLLDLLIGILVLAGGFLVYRKSQDSATEHDDYIALATQLAATYRQETNTVPSQLGGSILAGTEGLYTDIIAGQLQSLPFMVANAALARPTEAVDQNVTIAVIQTTKTFPHLLIVPDSIHSFYSPLELSKDHNLKPAELNGQGMQVYVTAGYELEALQVLTPPVLEKLTGLDFVLECTGSSLIAIQPRYATPPQMIELLTATFTHDATMQGLDTAITPIGDLPMTLHPSRSGQIAVGSGRLFVMIFGIIGAIALISLGLGVLIVHINK